MYKFILKIVARALSWTLFKMAPSNPVQRTEYYVWFKDYLRLVSNSK